MEYYDIVGVILQPLHQNVLFGGYLECEEGRLTGRLEDEYGISSIEGVLNVSSRQMSFNKKYETGGGEISYRFDRVEDIWRGFYYWKREVQGEALCELVHSGEEPTNDWSLIREIATLSKESIETLTNNLIKRMEERGFLAISGDGKTIFLSKPSQQN